jgi:hypothetical protein
MARKAGAAQSDREVICMLVAKALRKPQSKLPDTRLPDVKKTGGFPRRFDIALTPVYF